MYNTRLLVRLRPDLLTEFGAEREAKKATVAMKGGEWEMPQGRLL